MKTQFMLSYSYWFSSRSLGLFIHPYLTVQEICREKFMRPLVLLPLVIWLHSLVFGYVFVLLGTLFSLGRFNVLLILIHPLVFLWLCISVFCVLWQLTLLYLWFKFKN